MPTWDPQEAMPHSYGPLLYTYQVSCLDILCTFLAYLILELESTRRASISNKAGYFPTYYWSVLCYLILINNPDHCQNLITWSLCHFWPSLKISWTFVNNFWVMLLTDKQTNQCWQKTTFLAEVITLHIYSSPLCMYLAVLTSPFVTLTAITCKHDTS